MDMSQTEWKRTGEKYSQLNAACMTFRKLTSAMEKNKVLISRI